MNQSEARYAHIPIFEDIVCIVLIRVDKMGFHRRYDFVSLYSDSLSICSNWSLAVDWVEIFNGFSKNALSQGLDYILSEEIVFKFDIDDGAPMLRMYLNDQQDAKQYSFSKLECLQIYSKMSKILGKCDLVSQGGY